MSTHDYEALAREAVEMGWEFDSEKDEMLRLGRDERGFPVHGPNFEHEGTALAIIPWARSQPRWKNRIVTVHFCSGDMVRIDIVPYLGAPVEEMFVGDTLAHAALDCVRAGREGAE